MTLCPSCARLSWTVALVCLAGVPVWAVPQAPASGQCSQEAEQASATPQTPTPPPRPSYAPNAANEDWSVLKNPAARSDFWDPVKYIRIGGEDRFITLSGEIRYRPQGFRLDATDANQEVRDIYLLQRYFFGASVHLGPRFRVFTQLQSGLITGKVGETRPTDTNRIDLHQGFVEWTGGSDRDRRFSLRLGRQELTIGSSRLISASPTLNVKRSFDGARVSVVRGRWSFEGAAALLTALRIGAFDDNPLEDVKFWGVSAARPSPRWERGVLSSYYLGTENRDMPFAQGRGRDLRHTFGIAWRGRGRNLDLNYDLIFQTGSFAGSRITAWGVSTATGYRFTQAPWTPRVSVRVNSASGTCPPAPSREDDGATASPTACPCGGFAPRGRLRGRNGRGRPAAGRYS